NALLLTKALQLHLPANYHTLTVPPRIPCAVRMKVTLKEWNAVATWGWDMPEDE
ncbi:hypothetical protein EMPG_09939, partial [Blastomyces silverae]